MVTSIETSADYLLFVPRYVEHAKKAYKLCQCDSKQEKINLIFEWTKTGGIDKATFAKMTEDFL